MTKASFSYRSTRMLAIFSVLLSSLFVHAQQTETQTLKYIHGQFQFESPFDKDTPRLRVCLVKEKSNEGFVESASSDGRSGGQKLCTQSTDGTFSLPKPDSKKYKYISVLPSYPYKKIHEPNMLFFFAIGKKDTLNIELKKLPEKIVRDPSKPPMAEKPVLYLYPEREQNVSVRLDVKGELTTTYPEYNEVWNVIAQPDGMLQNTATGKQHPYLFWEAEIAFLPQHYQYTKGFCIKGDSTIFFLEETLAQLGLNPRESTDFITYWLPRMQHNKFNLIHFWVNDNYDNSSFMHITPKPESELRIMMEFTALDAPVNISPQVFKPFARKGFSVVEWGGVEVKGKYVL